MKKIILILLCIFLIGCSKEEKPVEEIEYTKPTEIVKIMRINISGNEYNVTLEENDTAQLLASSLPQEFQMRDKDRNKKYIYLSYKLPAKPEKVKRLEKGDVVLSGNDCLILVYNSFDTEESFTKIGHTNDLPTLGYDNMVMRFYK